MESNRVCHIIVAAGSGSRFGASLPKQFCRMCGRPVLMETIDRMRRFGGEADIVVVLSRDMQGMWADMCREASFVSPVTVDGGATRWESVRNALATDEAQRAGVITVHDGARPLLSAGLMERVMDLKEQGNIPTVAVTDSLRRLGPDDGSEAVDRSVYRAVQTPQAFRGPLLREAYERPYSPVFTDDASVMEAAGFTDLRLVEGDARNIKITHPGDIEVAALYMRWTD